MPFTKLATAVLVAVTAFGAISTPAMTTNLDASHLDLLNAVEEVGVRTYLNPQQCFDGDNAPDGFYVSQAGVLAICQDNATEPGKEIEWTPNDRDTLRHEAVHLLQDMLDGRGDNSLPHVFQDPSERAEFVIGAIGRDAAGRIIRSYGERGVDTHQIHNELEAFAFAASAEASDIALAIRQAGNDTK